ncbi:DNA binding protein [Phytophthora megakarya]|uniref:DNA binding protein n=1 Tax=Phytophthora megakarya TaxID=4795 RepID=A0A225W262_9STRA|nr:DNA binding protein [Phytophthora megakarya]
MVARAWVTVSNDTIVATDQTGGEFWEKVASHYNSIRPRSLEKYARKASSVEKRWKIIRLAVGKFCGYYASILQLNESGKNAEDHIDDAVQMYEKMQNQSFEFVDSWRELRDEPKWKDLRSSSNVRLSGSVRAADGLDQHRNGETTPNGDGNSRSRSIGKKKAKAERSIEVSTNRIADAAIKMSAASAEKVSIAAEKLKLLREREENRILFQPTAGLDAISLRILELKKLGILRRLEAVSCDETIMYIWSNDVPYYT